MNLSDEITKITSDIVGIPVAELKPDALLMDDLGLDSLRALEILAAIENKYSIRIDPERLEEMTTLNNIIKVTRDYTESQSAEYA